MLCEINVSECTGLFCPYHLAKGFKCSPRKLKIIKKIEQNI